MNLTQLPKTTSSAKRRLGQGHGSGRVKTSGRGTKGQKARRNIPLRFEGGALPLIKRLPFLRGKSRNKPLAQSPVVVSLSALNALPKGSVVDLKTLIEQRIVDRAEAQQKGVKILGEGSVTTAVTVTLPVSRSAREKIEQAGGSVQHTA